MIMLEVISLTKGHKASRDEFQKIRDDVEKFPMSIF
jgi:hypothetical protein